MKKFKCYHCNLVFEAEGNLKNFMDAIYGPCSRWVADCIQCGEECSQYSVNPARNNNSGTMAPCGNYSSCSCCGG